MSLPKPADEGVVALQARQRVRAVVAPHDVVVVVAVAPDAPHALLRQVLDPEAEGVIGAGEDGVDAGGRAVGRLLGDVAGVVDLVGVVAAAAVHVVGAAAAVEGVGAGAAEQRVASAFAVQRVGAAEPGQDVVAGVAVDHVGVAVAGAVDVAVAGEDEVLERGAELVVDRGVDEVQAAGDGVVRLLGGVVDVVDEVGVVAVAAVHRVRAAPAVEDVVGGAGQASERVHGDAGPDEGRCDSVDACVASKGCHRESPKLIALRLNSTAEMAAYAVEIHLSYQARKIVIWVVKAVCPVQNQPNKIRTSWLFSRAAPEAGAARLIGIRDFDSPRRVEAHSFPWGVGLRHFMDRAWGNVWPSIPGTI